MPQHLMCLGHDDFSHPLFLIDNRGYTKDLCTCPIVYVDKTIDNVKGLMMHDIVKYFGKDRVLCIWIFDIF